MDILEPTINSAAAQQRVKVAGDVAWAAQVHVFKKTQEIAEASLNTLLASVAVPPTGDVPLATSGTLGTQVNTYA